MVGQTNGLFARASRKFQRMPLQRIPNRLVNLSEVGRIREERAMALNGIGRKINAVAENHQPYGNECDVMRVEFFHEWLSIGDERLETESFAIRGD